MLGSQAISGGVVQVELVEGRLGQVAVQGNMLANAQDLVLSAPEVAIWPGLAIMLAVAGCTLLADGVRRR